MLKTLIKQYLDGRSEEYQYIDLLKDVLENGEMIKGRNGNVKTCVGSSMIFSLENDKIPILTTKKVAYKTCLKELLWFISGKTDNKILQDQNVKIWNGNASREFLDSRGLYDLSENDLGPVYGHQWRHFNAKYSDCSEDYNGKGVDQLKYVINCLKDPNERYSRRLIVSAWNPCQLDEMALPPCHLLMQFNVVGDKLSCTMYQRSCDMGLGVPFNITSYCYLTHLIAHHCGLKPHEFIYHLGNIHIYDDHLDSMERQILREPLEFPTIKILNKRENIDDYEFNDFLIENYHSHDNIKMEMRK